MSARPWVTRETREALKAILDARRRELEPPPPNPDSVARGAYRRRNIEKQRAWDKAYAPRRKELRDARAASAGS